MIEVIHEHSLDTSLLPDGANILDIGCSGFLFTDYFRSLGNNVHALDIQELQGEYHKLAITNYSGFADVYECDDKHATRLNRRFNKQSESSIITLTLQSFSNHVGIEFWDLIKMDVEGSEYEIIMSLEQPPAKQLSIEFHLHTGIYGEKEMIEMESKLLSLGYIALKHEKTSEHGAGFNYWDSLFVLK